jgi:iron-sulfur cluster assembly protein
LLIVTPNASQAIQSILSNAQLPSGSGLRIVPGAQTDGSPTDSTPLQLEVAAQPEAQDEVVSESGANVFLEPNVAPILSDKVLDAQMDQEGKVRFVLGQQQEPPTAPM